MAVLIWFSFKGFKIEEISRRFKTFKISLEIPATRRVGANVGDVRLYIDYVSDERNKVDGIFK
jgi:hypothetical protein